MSVLTKISHNFYCHFNVPALCEGSQSRRGRKAGGVCCGGGGDQADSGAERERLWCSDGLSVTLYSSYPSSTQINSDRHTVTRHTHVRISVSLRPPVTTFWNPQNVPVKRVHGWQPSSALQEDPEDRRAYHREKKKRNNKEDQNST